MPRTQGLIPLRSQTQELEKAYFAVQREITTDLLKIDIGNFSEYNAIRTQQKDIKLVDSLSRFMARWAKKSLPKAYKISADIAQTTLLRLGKKPDQFYDRHEHQAAIDAAIAATVGDFTKANQSIKNSTAIYVYLAGKANKALQAIQLFDLRDEETIAALLDDALRAGASRETAEGLILNHFKDRMGAGQLININGRSYQMNKYAQMVARTRLRTVQSEAVKQMSAQYGSDLVEISSHGTEDDICKEFEGNVYSISGNTPGYEVLTEWPPFHPNCEHSAAPTSAEAISFREFN